MGFYLVLQWLNLNLVFIQEYEVNWFCFEKKLHLHCLSISMALCDLIQQVLPSFSILCDICICCWWWSLFTLHSVWIKFKIPKKSTCRLSLFSRSYWLMLPTPYLSDVWPSCMKWDLTFTVNSFLFLEKCLEKWHFKVCDFLVVIICINPVV